MTQVSNVATGDQPNRIVIAAKLTHAAAQAVVDRVPGTSIQKVLADK